LLRKIVASRTVFGNTASHEIRG